VAFDANRGDLVEVLARLGLIGPGDCPVIKPLTGGVSSEIVRVELRSGVVCAKRARERLQVAEDWRAPVARNAFEAQWIRTVGEIVPGRVPDVLAEDRAAGLFVMSYFPPDSHPVWKAQLGGGHIDVATAKDLGTLMAVIHGRTADDPRLRALFGGAADLFFALRLDPYFLSTARVHPECAERLRELSARTARVRRVLVHGDFSPKNILIGVGGPVLLDAEACCFGDPAFDLAFCLNHLLLKCLWHPRWRDAYLACFDALAAAYLDGVTWESRAGLEARAATLLPALMLARVDGKSPVEYLTGEDQRTLVRGTALRLLRQNRDRLAAVRDVWATVTA
jgi:Phosphotransferase enzyme family